MRIAAILCALAGAAEPGAGARPVLVVTAEAPLDGERLADVLRSYLDGFEVDVRAAPAAAAADLRAELGATRRAAEDLRAIAAVRIGRQDRGACEIKLVDLLTAKSLVTSIARPARDEDLYRAVALKVQALLRSTLAESPEAVASQPGLSRLVAPPAAAGAVSGAPAPALPPSRAFLEVGYNLVSFPLGGVVEQGLLVAAGYRPVARASISLGARVLTPQRRDADEVSLVASSLPLVLGADLRFVRGRFETTVGALAEVALRRVEVTLPASPPRAERSWVPAAGVTAALRARVWGAAAVQVRAAALGVLAADRYRVRGRLVFDASRLELALDAGVHVPVF